MLLRWVPRVCPRAVSPVPKCSRLAAAHPILVRHSSAGLRLLHSTGRCRQIVTPLRKEIKDTNKAARAARREGGDDDAAAGRNHIEGWELTVGIEIHAQLNTARKLFSGERYALDH